MSILLGSETEKVRKTNSGFETSVTESSVFVEAACFSLSFPCPFSFLENVANWFIWFSPVILSPILMKVNTEPVLYTHHRMPAILF